MSEFAARSALERMNLREVAVAPHQSTIAADMSRLASADPQVEQQKFMDMRRDELCVAYGFEGSDGRKPFAFANGIAIIPVSGTLINRFGQSYSFVTGYNFIRRQVALALADEDVKGIVADINSYGGEAAGCFEASAEIFAARGKKPMIAVIDSNCYSAAYAMATAFDKIVCTPSGGAGSIGVVAMHVDMSKMLKDWGLEISFIHFGDHKVDGNPYEPLPEAVKADIQKGVNRSGEAFVELVAKQRNIDAKTVRDTQARTYRADDALALGLIDAIATPSMAVQAFFDELSGSNSQQQMEDAMSTQTETQPGGDNKTATTAAAPVATPAAAAAPATNEQALAEARTAERARVAGITGSDEAKGKSQLANHLAMNTDMNVDQAKAVLSAAAPEASTAATAGNPFKTTMDADKHPGVGASENPGGEGGETAYQRIMSDQAAFTGLKLVQ